MPRKSVHEIVEEAMIFHIFSFCLDKPFGFFLIEAKNLKNILVTFVVIFLLSASLFFAGFAHAQITRHHTQIDQLVFVPDVTSVSCSISTSQLTGVSAGSLVNTAYWIGITVLEPIDAPIVNEFMQIGWNDLNANGPTAFWATYGSVDSTNYQAQQLQSLAVGSVHQYSISFDGSNWNLILDGVTVKQIPFPYISSCGGAHVTVCQENIGFNPNSLNSGVVTFSGATVTFAGVPKSYPLFALPLPNSGGPIAALWMEKIEGTNNGISVVSASEVQIGWGLSTTILFQSPFSSLFNVPPPSSDTMWLIIGAIIIVVAVVIVIAVSRLRKKKFRRRNR